MKKVFLAALIYLPLFAAAQGFQVNLQGQKQTAMAGAGSALILDETTLFFNPGGMSMLPRNSIGAGINPLWFKSAFQQAGSQVTEHVEDHVAPPFAGYGVWGPTGARWKLGLGVYTPFGGLVDWGDQWSGRYTLVSLDLKAIYIQPTFSFKITDALGIGAGFVYNHGSADLQRAIPVNFPDGRDGHATLKGGGSGIGWNAGVYYKTPLGVSLALTYRSKVTTKLNDGDAIFDVPASVRDNFPAGNTFDAELPLPATTTLGIGIPLSDRTALALDASFVQWDVYKELAFDYATNTPILQDTRSERNYKNGGSVKLGIQHAATNSLSLRAGVGYVFTPVKDGYVTPEAPDANRLMIGAGLGYSLTTNWELNASFLFEDIVARKQTNRETNLAGTFKTFVYAPGISISYKW